MTPPPPAKVLTMDGVYEICEPLGHGSFGAVYSVSRLVDGHLFALKQFKSSRDAEIEMDMLRRVRGHVNIMFPEDILPNGDLVMELCAMDLHKYISKKQTFIPTYKIMKQICQGLTHCHARGISHCDLKLENILVTLDGVIKIADFGIAHVMSKTTPLLYSIYTLWYRAPELILHAKKYVTAEIDIWALGIIFLELLHQRRLFAVAKTEEDQLKLIFKLLGAPKKVSKFLVLSPEVQVSQSVEFYNRIFHDDAHITEKERYLALDMLQINPDGRIPLSFVLEYFM